MYGLVNRAFEELIVSRYGQERWQSIKAEAGVDVDVFISNEPYAEEITYNLVGAATRTLDMPLRQLLLDFGQHWVLKTGLEHYGPLLRSGGSTLKEFLVNLQHFHTRVQLFYPKLRPPSFSCSDVSEKSLKLHYMTHRPGLTDFVEGLVIGLGQLYETSVEVSLVQSRATGADSDVFEVRWGSEVAS